MLKHTIKSRAVCWLCCGIAAALTLTGTFALTACSSDDTTAATDGKPLEFAAQVEQHVTRTPYYGVMNNATLATTGFGVFAYGTSGTANLFATPQHVTYNQSGITAEEPIGDVHLHPVNWSYGTQHKWMADETYDFYAYAPYEDITATGNASGPTISYTVATNPAESIDLLWGVKGETGLPWLSQTRDSNGGLVLFSFRHALAAIGLHVQAMIDKDNILTDLTDEADPENLLGTDALKITLQSITITPKTNLFYSSGTLNLNNGTPYTPAWTPGSRGIASLTLSSSQINSSLTDGGAGVLKTADTQTVIAQNGGKDQFFMLIPDAAQNYEVSVEYTVTYKTGTGTYKTLTYSTAGSNAGKATFSSLPLMAGLKYWLNLVIGLKSVSLCVTAEDWEGVPIDIEELTERGTSANSSLALRADR